MKKVNESTILFLTDSLSLKMFTLQEDKQVQPTTQMGFLCPFCVMAFHSHQELHKFHMKLHSGRVKCKKCKVGISLAWNRSLLKIRKI